MALNMMMAPVGSRLKVSGMRIAVPAAGPRPGSTPMSVPSMQPRKANVRLSTESAAARPFMRRENVSKTHLRFR
ncbi:hypothetical protein D9M72_621710 [compost metagenome]